MAKLIECDCGAVLRAESDEELVTSVESHLERAHPELVGKFSRDEILGMAEEGDDTTRHPGEARTS